MFHLLRASVSALGIFAAGLAHAGLISLDFNNINDAASNSTVQTKINEQLAGTGITATVAGARGEKNYTGDGHVVGPLVTTSNGPQRKSLTLGNSDFGVYHGGALDGFLVNSTTNNDRITMTFSEKIFGVSFDFEIFPDGTCPNGGTNGCLSPTSSNWPDFTLKADGALVFTVDAEDPSNLAAVSISAPITVVAPVAPNLLDSPMSGATGAPYELAPQLLAMSGWWDIPGGAYKLEFIDWPRQIGIDNLQMTTVPEPGSLALVAAGLGAGWLRRRIAGPRA